MSTIIARDLECRLLKKLLLSEKAEFLAVYGRRRVGKTFLIDRYFSQCSTYYDFTGQRNTTLQKQIKNVCQKLKLYFSNFSQEEFLSWSDVFFELRRVLQASESKDKMVLFFDELPWFCSHGSKFKEALEYFWNDWVSKQTNIILVICGSAASWMLDNVIRDKGGLHNRVTETIHLTPFSLSQTKQFLESKSIHLQNKQILDLYMVMGGIPFYLNKVESGKSSAQIIDELCFQKNGFLYGEYDNLFQSLFDRPDKYIAIVELLAKTRKGMTRNDIVSGLKCSSGGTLTKTLNSLVECGFIGSYIPFQKKGKDCLYRLTDEYSLFYLTWIKPRLKELTSVITQNYWIQIRNSSPWKAWSGYSFESICIKHAAEIVKALGISGTLTKVMPWHHQPKKGTSVDDRGAQIDMLIDRHDQCINLCEMKFSETPYSISKQYSRELEQKIQVFKNQTKITKTIFLTFITTYGCKENEQFLQMAHHNLTMDCLFEKES